jgi:hypothetical protein
VYVDDDHLNSAAVLGSRIAKLACRKNCQRSGAPKLLSKARLMDENASGKSSFLRQSRCSSDRLLETSLPGAAAQAVTDIGLFWSSGASGRAVPRYAARGPGDVASDTGIAESVSIADCSSKRRLPIYSRSKSVRLDAEHSCSEFIAGQGFPHTSWTPTNT